MIMADYRHSVPDRQSGNHELTIKTCSAGEGQRSNGAMGPEFQPPQGSQAFAARRTRLTALHGDTSTSGH